MGMLEEIPDDSDHRSMQFLTSSEDGTVLIWDLLKKPTIQPGGFKVKKLKRLKKRPSALMADVSPYTILHLNLKPIYKVKVRRPDDRSKVLAIANCYSNFCKMKYVEVNPDKNKKANITDRIMYTPVFERGDEELKPRIHVGTMEEIVNSEFSQMLSFAKYHDGPVNSVHTADATKATLTVGGKIFAVWREDFKNRPILWRRNRQLYTSGEWNTFEPFTFTNKLVNGEVENWILYASSKTPIWSLACTSEYLTTSAIHPLKLKKNIYGAGDRQGAFRLFSLYEDSSKGTVESKIKVFDQFLDREVQRKKRIYGMAGRVE
ncbi:hypothetical protein NQ314_020338 [Rhamnusium bicolor]|uniref:Uncharacterized protein n=1 Tax=Rhamnusium bicolor TaxID=1586634 RepID=A0AAV8WLV6_9CUCU|nr:hypothetical protein NQ314_020338 [Rhamnusium bicolor]